MARVTSDAAADSAGSTCACCGELRPDTYALQSRPDVAICGGCAGWLVHRRDRPAGVIDAIPILPVRDLDAAAGRFERMGFDVQRWDDTYAFVRLGGAELNLARRPDLDPDTTTSMVYVEVTDADATHARWLQADIGGHLEPPQDMPWDMREGRWVDPEGNLLRFGSPLPH